MGNLAPRIVRTTLALALLLGGSACDSSKPASANRALPADAGAGLLVFTRMGCAVCHSFDNTVLAGPSLRNIYGKEVKLLDGTTLVRDDEYIRTSILDSGKQVVAGFRPTMVNYASMLQEGDIDNLLALIRFHSE